MFDNSSGVSIALLVTGTSFALVDFPLRLLTLGLGTFSAKLAPLVALLSLIKFNLIKNLKSYALGVTAALKAFCNLFALIC